MLTISSSAVVNSTLWILAGFSVATWTIILFKSWQYWTLGRQNQTFTSAFWNAPELGAAVSLPPSQTKGPLARIAQDGFGWLADIKSPGNDSLRYRGDPQNLLERALERRLQREQRLLESGLTVLASIGSTAPFVGLFGTVLGIMHALQEISKSGSASLDVVAGPIGEALVATAIGIAVAVPAVLAYNFFLRRAKLNRTALENFARDFLHLVSRTSLS